MKTMLKIFAYLALACVILLVIGAVVIYSGSYNVAAATRHTKLVHASLDKLMINSVRAHARNVTVPPDLNLQDRALARGAVEHFEVMCAMCHGAPGREPDRWSQALYPPPPDLIHALRDRKWSDPEVFWIIKHGIKDSGMAAFGESHGDRDLWTLTALVRQFLEITPNDYRAMVDRTKAPEPTGRAQSSRAEKSGTSHKH